MRNLSMASIAALKNSFIKPGQVVWIGVRTKRKEKMKTLVTVEVDASGLKNDHYTSIDGKRAVTFIQNEHLQAVGSFLRLKEVDPGLVRRNVVVQGINLNALKEKKFQIGTVIFEYTGECHPCSRMETHLGPGGYNAMRGHGGITARVIQPGQFKLGHEVVPIMEEMDAGV